jgi:AbrB family looped-hinge helix DNA binding protein
MVARIVRVSSKGQVVIPAALRRRLRIHAGQPLALRAGSRDDELILRPVDSDTRAVDAMLRKLRRAATALGRDLLAEMHERRGRDREAEGHGRGRA